MFPLPLCYFLFHPSTIPRSLNQFHPPRNSLIYPPHPSPSPSSPSFHFFISPSRPALSPLVFPSYLPILFCFLTLTILPASPLIISLPLFLSSLPLPTLSALGCQPEAAAGNYQSVVRKTHEKQMHTYSIMTCLAHTQQQFCTHTHTSTPRYTHTVLHGYKASKLRS